jgi:peptide deformylase
MLDAMYAAPGRGLAAPQVGVTQRLFVMDTTWKDAAPTPQVFVNPQIIWCSETATTMDEGCLSIPGQLVPVTRPAEVDLRWQSLDGTTQQARQTGFAAACVQHEVDHLDGILCTDHAERTP